MSAAARPGSLFAIATREEVWVLDDRVLREERLSHGVAISQDAVIVATDSADEDLLAVTDEEMNVARAALMHAPGVVARVVVTARRCGEGIASEAVISLSATDLSIVSSPQHVREDCELLLRLAAAAGEVAVDWRDVPVIWRNGTGAVLLHEAVGHPAEHQREPLAWPSWLAVHDEPLFAAGDDGEPVSRADLLRGEMPSAVRRASFADVPLRRLSNVVARQTRAPFDLPGNRIEVVLVGGGSYDPVTDTVSIFVSAADLIEGDRVRRVKPFLIADSRPAIAAALRGAEGPPLRYPGVVCSSEGQEIFVGSHAPVLVTAF